ncbi:hypothetical protein AK812_SmicGene33176 [Symbiodinium microadriaticum]|uniref:Uncharacterized protein n=1 Tax=Symbiodinium microadriaticum TaxID=2951 RepID=A0A1Q9CS90_SYMMI|nr:hypothetical protein AK812_SmicGene33176 [Symbiodinium microadriaticum]
MTMREHYQLATEGTVAHSYIERVLTPAAAEEEDEYERHQQQQQQQQGGAGPPHQHTGGNYPRRRSPPRTRASQRKHEGGGEQRTRNKRIKYRIKQFLKRHNLMHTEWGDWSPQPAPNRTDGEPSQAETQPATATDTQGRSTSRRRIYSTPESRAEFAAVLNLHAHPRTAPPHGSKEHTYQEQRPEGGTPSSGGGHPNHEQQQQAQASDLPASSDNNPEPQQQAFSSTDTAPQPTEQQPRTNTGNGGATAGGGGTNTAGRLEADSLALAVSHQIQIIHDAAGSLGGGPAATVTAFCDVAANLLAMMYPTGIVPDTCKRGRKRGISSANYLVDALSSFTHHLHGGGRRLTREDLITPAAVLLEQRRDAEEGESREPVRSSGSAGPGDPVHPADVLQLAQGSEEGERRVTTAASAAKLLFEAAGEFRRLMPTLADEQVPLAMQLLHAAEATQQALFGGVLATDEETQTLEGDTHLDLPVTDKPVCPPQEGDEQPADVTTGGEDQPGRWIGLVGATESQAQGQLTGSLEDVIQQVAAQTQLDQAEDSYGGE